MKIYSGLRIQNYTEFDGVFLIAFDYGFEHYDLNYPLSRIEIAGAELTIETDEGYNEVKRLLDEWLETQPGIHVCAGEQETFVFDTNDQGFKIDTVLVNTVNE